MIKGMLFDGYTHASLTGQNNAGLVYEISYNSSSKEGGVMRFVYSTANANGGRNYAVSSSEIHNSWALTGWFVQGNDSRTVGVICDYFYLSRDNMANPSTPAPFKSENKGRSDSQMKDSGMWNSFSASIWDINGGYPTIWECQALMHNFI